MERRLKEILKQGFTLIEIIVSIFLLSIVAISFFMLTSFCLTIMVKANSQYESVNHVEEIVDELTFELEKANHTGVEIESLEECYSEKGLQVTIEPYLFPEVLDVKVSDIATGTRIRTLVKIK